ncbi:hypothetical protein EDD21DRAFT_391658 [Dissophora ornata]|nr:hypothetical protein EDD21DRAFT_391658 [Dissophora ornata]
MMTIDCVLIVCCCLSLLLVVAGCCCCCCCYYSAACSFASDGWTANPSFADEAFVCPLVWLHHKSTKSKGSQRD